MDKKLIIGILIIVLLVSTIFLVPFFEGLLFAGELVALEKIQVAYEVTGSPERIDNNYLRAKVRWVVTVTTDKAMCLTGYLLDLDKALNNSKQTYNSKPLVVRKNLDLKIYPKDITVQVPLESVQTTIAESKTGINPVAVGDTTQDVSVTTNPLILKYYLSNPSRGNEYKYPFDIELTVGSQTTKDTYEVYTSQYLTFFDGKVKIAKAGNLVSEIDIPTWKDYLFIPLDPSIPSQTGEVVDNNNNRYLVIPSGYATESRLLNKDSSTSYNAYLWGNPNSQNRYSKWQYGWLDLWNRDILRNTLRCVTQGDIPPSAGTGIAISLYYNTIATWTSGVTIWSYPRQPSLTSDLQNLGSDYFDLNKWYIEKKKGCGTFDIDCWTIARYEPPCRAFFPWFLSQVKTMNPKGVEPIPRNWKIEDNYMKVTYPASVRPQMIVIYIDSEAADTVLYDPLVSSFKFTEITSSSDVVRGGQSIRINVGVKNTGNVKATATIIAESNIFHLDMRTATVTLSPGETKITVFSAYYGGTEKVEENIIFKLQNSEGELQDTSSLKLKGDAPVGGLFLGLPTLSDTLEYGKNVKMKVPVINKQGLTFKNIKVRIFAPTGFSVNPSEQVKDCSSSETIYEFTVSTSERTPGFQGTFKIELIKDNEVIDTVYYSVTTSTPSPTPDGGGGGKDDIWKTIIDKLSFIMPIFIILGILLMVGGAILRIFLGWESAMKVAYVGIALTFIGAVCSLLLYPSPIVASGIIITGVILIILCIILGLKGLAAPDYLSIIFLVAVTLIILGVVMFVLFL